MRILLVEDDASVAAEFARSLRAENCAFDVASNREDTAYLGETERHDIAVLDLGLPKMAGVSAVQAWRSAGRASRCRSLPPEMNGLRRS